MFRKLILPLAVGLVITGLFTAPQPEPFGGSLTTPVTAPIGAPVSGPQNANESLQEFLDNYCVKCHGQKKKSGGVSLNSVEHWDSVETIEEIHNQLKLELMPPAKEKKRPSEKEIANVLDLLSTQIKKRESTELAGTLKRINRVEYQNMINDVFHADFNIINDLPPDNFERHGFNNTGNKLFVGPRGMEIYQKVATNIVSQLIESKPLPRTYVFDVASKNIALGDVRVTDGVITMKKKVNSFAVVAGGFRDIGHYHVNIESNDKNLKFAVTLKKGQKKGRKNQSHFKIDGSNRTMTTQLGPDSHIRLNVGSFKSVTITGPYVSDWPPQAYVYDTFFDGVEMTDGQQTANRIIDQIASQLFRYPLTKAELKSYHSLAKNEFDKGKDVYVAVAASVKAMLCSPMFLYKQEGNSKSLDNFAIASRMSFMLWNSGPDSTLRKLAATGKLTDPKVRKEQAVRMLQDPKSKRFSQDFAYQWLELKLLEDISPDTKLLETEEMKLSKAEYNRIRPDIKHEPIAFFDYILSNNLSMLNFIDSDFVVITPELEKELYQLKTIKEEKKNYTLQQADKNAKLNIPEIGRFGPVKLDRDDRGIRGGLLSQAGILLMTTNNGEYTNPFYRGAWVVRTFYGDDLQPPESQQISALDPPSPTKTISDHIEMHRKDLACRNCHVRFDAYGLALERYDVLGKWRDTYSQLVPKQVEAKVIFKRKVTKKTEILTVYNTKPMLPVIAKSKDERQRLIDGPVGVKRALMEDKDKIAGAFIGKLYTYMMGRKPRVLDREQLEPTLRRFIANEYKIKDLVVDMIASDFFAKR